MNVAIIGASGYTGLELIKILINHPEFNITYIANSTGEQNVNELHPCLQKVLSMPVSKASAVEVAVNAQLAFLALPHQTSMSFAKELLTLGVKVVDLSADYRLELETYEKTTALMRIKRIYPMQCMVCLNTIKRRLKKPNLLPILGVILRQRF